jgi:hypothetical protein
MHYLEDELAEKCLSQTLYPNTKIIVDRKTLEQKRKEEKLIMGSTQSEINQNKANLFDDLDTAFTDYRESETYTNELRIEIDFSEVDPKILSGGAEDNEKVIEVEETKMVTIGGVSGVAQKQRGLIQSSAAENENLKEEEEEDSNEDKELVTETEESEDEESNESTESENSSEDKPKRNRFGLLKRIAAAIFGKISRFR